MRSLRDFIWESRYRRSGRGVAELDLPATYERVARAVAQAESDPGAWSVQFAGLLHSGRFVPGGRILAGAGMQSRQTLANCFVMPRIEDSIEGIFDSLKQSALTVQSGGGIGVDFSGLRPRGSPAGGIHAVAAGPVAFLTLWDAMSEAIASCGARRGAMMGTLSCDHPDVMQFIEAKRDRTVLPHFNLSVQVTDAFLRAARASGQGSDAVAARVWERIAFCAAESGEPGVLFVDRINAENNLKYCETLTTTNPCGEAPLPGHGSCLLGSVNLAQCVRDAFAPGAELDLQAVAETATVAVRFLDDVLEISTYPIAEQRSEARRTRRIGIGLTGLADAIAMLGLRYDSEAARLLGSRVAEVLRDASYRASIALAEERGPFQAYQRDAYNASPFVHRLPAAIRDALLRSGIRNSHLLAIAPAGSISLLAGNVSSGVEPIAGLQVARHVRARDGNVQVFHADDQAYAIWREQHESSEALPPGLLNPQRVSAAHQLRMQAALQPFIDGAISKTVALPADSDCTEAQRLFEMAHDLGLKGCALYRAGSRSDVIGRGAIQGPEAADN